MSRNFVRTMVWAMILSSCAISMFTYNTKASVYWALVPCAIVVVVFAAYGAIMYWMVSGLDPGDIMFKGGSTDSGDSPHN